MSSHSECIEELVLGQNSFWLGNCYILLHSGMDFQWILEAQSMRRHKVTPPVSGVLLGEKLGLVFEIDRLEARGGVV